MLLSYSRFQPFSVSASGCLFVARHLQLISMFLSLHSSSRLLRERTCEVLEDREEEKNPASCRKRTCITAKRKKSHRAQHSLGLQSDAIEKIHGFSLRGGPLLVTKNSTTLCSAGGWVRGCEMECVYVCWGRTQSSSFFLDPSILIYLWERDFEYDKCQQKG